MKNTFTFTGPLQNGFHQPLKSYAKPYAAIDLRDLFIDELKDINWAEKAFSTAIQRIIENTTSEELSAALIGHFQMTIEHLRRLDDVFFFIGEKAEVKKSEAMAGLIKEADEITAETQIGLVRDAGIISAMQKIGHYEIASYGTLYSFAKILGEDEVAIMLKETLNEEKKVDAILTKMAETYINIEAIDSNPAAK